MQTEQLLRVSQVSVSEACLHARLHEWMCALSSPRCASVCDAFMVTDSFHLSRPFTLKKAVASEEEEEKKRSSLDSFSSSPAAAAVDSSAQESPLQRSHPFKPASRSRGPAPCVNRQTSPQGLEDPRGRLCLSNARNSVKIVALSIVEERVEGHKNVQCWVLKRCIQSLNLYISLRYRFPCIGSPFPLFLMFQRHICRRVVKPLSAFLELPGTKLLSQLFH